MTPRRMRPKTLPALLAVAVISGLQLPVLSAESNGSPADAGGSCSYDRAKYLALDYQTFDQTPNRGWRDLAAGDKCLAEAADLIRDYRTTNNLPHPMLFWHEGQLRALNGSVSQAIPLMEMSRPLAAGISGWNEYVDVTVAFLRKDRAAYDKARAALAAIPKAPYLGVVDRLGQCFGNSYKQSYRACEKQ